MPEEVAATVAHAIEANVAEIDVAAPLLRLGGVLGSIVPAFVASLARRQKAGELRQQMIAARASEREDAGGAR